MNRATKESRRSQIIDLLAINSEQTVRQAIARRFPGVEAIGRSVALHPLHGWSCDSAVDVLQDAIGRTVVIAPTELNASCDCIDDLVDLLDRVISRELHNLYT